MIACFRNIERIDSRCPVWRQKVYMVRRHSVFLLRGQVIYPTTHRSKRGLRLRERSLDGCRVAHLLRLRMRVCICRCVALRICQTVRRRSRTRRATAATSAWTRARQLLLKAASRTCLHNSTRARSARDARTTWRASTSARR